MPRVSREKSKIKMVILRPPGKPNQTWWSFENENSKPSTTIIVGMRKRFERSKYAGDAQVLQFYENGKLIDEHKY